MFARINKLIQQFTGYWKVLLQDIDGFPSSKRLVMVVALAMIVVAFVANLFWHSVIDGRILDAIKWLGGASGAGVAGERFGKLMPAPSAKPTDEGIVE